MRAPQRLIDPNHITVDEIEDITNRVTRYEIEDVTPPPVEKFVHNDAVHLFPLHMYKEGNLNITGNTNMDKQASPHLPSQTVPPISDNDTTMSSETEPMSDSEDSHSTTSTLETSLPQVEPEQHVNTCSTDHPGATVPLQGMFPPTFTPQNDHDSNSVDSEGGPSSSQGGSPNADPTMIINEDQLYDLLYRILPKMLLFPQH